MSLPMLESTQKLRTALQAKAKPPRADGPSYRSALNSNIGWSDPHAHTGGAKSSFRFYSLYDKVSRKDVLWDAWTRCRINGGASGIDGQTFADIEKLGAMEWLNPP